MIYQYQKGDRDCYPTCFRNAFKHFDVKINSSLENRLLVFDNGAENCSMAAAREKREKYERSIHKFKTEWWKANHYQSYTGSDLPKLDDWALYLMKEGIDLCFRNGPIEQKAFLLDELLKNKLVICPIMIPSSSEPEETSRHSVLIVNTFNEFLYIHDPLESNLKMAENNNNYQYINHHSGVNLKIRSNFFFKEDKMFMKPEVNPNKSDTGYTFVTISRKNCEYS